MLQTINVQQEEGCSYDMPGPKNYHAAGPIIGTHKSDTGEGHALRRSVHEAENIEFD
jgi:hypothetical protein